MKNYFRYVGLILFGILLLGFMAMQPEDPSFNVSLKRIGLARYNITASDTLDVSAAPDTLPRFVVDTSAQHFLLIGDSMSEHVRVRLNDYCVKNGHTADCVIWYSATSEWYGKTDTLTWFLNKYKPTYVLINLGSNELFVDRIKEKRATYVKHIVEQLSDVSYVWIGPPNWKEDTGINELIDEIAGEGHYFDSRHLTYERASDGAHPVRRSSYNWMDSLAVYLRRDAATQIRMEYPDAYLNKAPNTQIVQRRKK